MGNQDKLYKALKEVSIVLEYTDPELRAKVPKNFIWFMDNFKDDSHNIQIDLNRPLRDQKLSYETVVILSIILKSAWCDKKTLRKLEQSYKVNRKDFMNDRKQKKTEIENEIRSLTIPKKESIFSRMWNGIKRAFGRNNSRIYIPD